MSVHTAYKSSGFTLEPTNGFKQPEIDVGSESLRHTQKIARSSRPGRSKRRTIKQAQKNYLANLKKEGTITLKRLPMRKPKTTPFVPPRLTRTSSLRVSGKKSRRKNTKKRKLTKKKNRKGQKS